MGADGGICYFKIKDSSKIPRLLELIKPFNHIFCYNDKNHDKEYDEWFDDNAWIYHHIYSYYGSFIECGFDEFYTAISSENKNTYYTFADILDDLETFPYYIDKYSLQPLWYFIWKFVKYQCSSYDNAREKLSHIKNMKISSWLDELNNNISGLYYCEVWT